MKKTKLFKSLLLAAGMLAGSASAWAQDWSTVWTADFSSAPSGMTYSVTNGSVDISSGVLFYHQGGGSGDRALNTAFTADAFKVDTNWKMEFDWGASSANKNASNVAFATNNGTVFTITWASYATTVSITDANSNTLTSTLPIDGYNKSTMTNLSHFTITGDTENGIYLTVTNGGTTYVNNILVSSTFGYPATFNGSLGRAASHMALDNVTFSIPAVAGFVPAPTSTLTGANGTARKFTLSCLDADATIYYSETELAADAEGWTAYTGEVTTEVATIYAVAKKGSDVSEVYSFATGAGTEIALNAPTVFTDGLAANGEYFNAILNASYNAAGVEFTPAATLTATFTPKGGTATDITLPYTATERGELTVTATAEGFASASTTIEVYASYEQSWISTDYSTVTANNVAEVLGEGWTLSEGTGRWASWNAGNEPYTYYQNTAGTGVQNVTIEDNIRVRNVVVLNMGYGLARNVSGGEAITIINTNKGDIVAFKIYNGYGNRTAAESNYTSYELNNGADPSMSSNNGALLMQATIYSPAKTTFTAKYYNSKGWEKVYAYTFNGETLGGWAGKELTAGENGLYDVTFESVDAPEKIIFNNGSSNTDEVKTNQTGDLDFVDGAAYCFDGQGEVYSFTFTTNKGWSNIYAYTWSGENEIKVEQLGAWKGTQINDGRLTFVATTAPEKIIFNNGEGTQSPEMVFTNGEAYTYNSTYVVAGVEAVFGVAWDKDAEANKLDENNQLTITGITLAKGDYEYQVVADGDWNTKTDSKYLGVKMDGKYDIVITFDPATKEVTDAMAVYKSISSAGYATFCAPYDLNFEGTDVTAYVGAKDGTKITFSEVTSVKAGTGLLLKANEGSYAIAMEESSNTVENNALVGVLEDTPVAAGSFVLMNGKQGVGFYKAASEFTVGANTAYIEAQPATTGEGARSFIAIDGEATAIEGIAAEKAQDGVIYNLQGQRVVKAQKGLYIINGKKVLVK